MVTLYGIRNCDTVRKARRWLDDHGVEYRFHDFRKDGLDDEHLHDWMQRLGWERLLNRRGTSWRSLPETVREGIDEQAAIAIMKANPAVIKRPLLDTGRQLQLGFSAEDYRDLLC
mgnify:FL=1